MLHDILASSYLSFLHLPDFAGWHAQLALSNDPANVDAQRTLKKAIGLQSLLYSGLSFPLRALQWLRELALAVRLRPFLVLLALTLLLKPLLLFLLWLALISPVMLPLTVAYDLGFVRPTLVQSSAGRIHFMIKSRLQTFPLWARVGAMTAMAALSWLTLVWLLGLPVLPTVICFALLTLAQLCAVWLYDFCQRKATWRAYYAQQRAELDDPPQVEWRKAGAV